MINAWWLTLPIAIAVGLAVFSLLLWKRALPFPDYGSFVFTCWDEQARRTILAIMTSHGQQPAYRADSPNISRAIFRSGLILNVVDPKLREKLGNPAGGFAIVVKSIGPARAALSAAAFLRSEGYNAQVFEEDGMPDKISFVVTNAMVGSILVFREHVMELGKPQPWRN